MNYDPCPKCGNEFNDCGCSLSNRTKLNDGDRMPFGKHKGKQLGEVPDRYWLWFLDQEWADDHPDLLAYAKLVEES